MTTEKTDPITDVANRLDSSYQEQTRELHQRLGPERYAEVTAALDARWQLAAEIGADSQKLGAGFQMVHAGIMRLPHVWDGEAGIREIEEGLDAMEDAIRIIRGRTTVARTRGAVVNV